MDDLERYPPTYRAPQARQVMTWIQAGQSGCLVGLRGAGKSNLARFLLRPDVRQHYLGPAWANTAFVLVDLLALVEPTEWAVYELILDRLAGMGAALAALAALHQEVTRSRDRLTAQRAVERGVAILCQPPARRIVLLLDEFDAVFRDLDPSLFRCLRAIRDAHKGQVSYVVIVTDDLADLRDDLAGVDHFYRLVSRNVCDLGPYGEADARQMIHHLAARRSVELDEEDATRLVQLSGGHAGLLKAILSQSQGAGLAATGPALCDEPIVRAECRQIWDSLAASQQEALRGLAGGSPVDRRALQRLARRGLVRQDPTETRIFSPLFADYVRQQAPLSTTGTVITRSPRQIQIGGRCIETLTGLEFEMLCYLYEHRGRVCTKDELIQNVYAQRYDRMAGGVSDEALQTLIARLRAKIEPDRERPRYVVTVRGEGYRFDESDEEQSMSLR